MNKSNHRYIFCTKSKPISHGEGSLVSTETVVFFYVQEKSVGRKYPWEKVEFEVLESKWCGRRLVAAGIPEYDFNKRIWKKEALRKKIRTELIPKLEIDFWETTCFFYHKSLVQTEIGRLLEELFPLELILVQGKNGIARSTPEDVIETLLQEYCRYDALIVMDGTAQMDGMTHAAEYKEALVEWQDSVTRQIDLPELMRKHCDRVNYLVVVTADAERYVEVFEEMDEEYGLTGVFLSSIANLKLPTKHQVLVVDAGIAGKHTWRDLPPCCTYLDLVSDTERQRIMEARRKDVHYVSFYRQLEKKLRQKM